MGEKEEISCEDVLSRLDELESTFTQTMNRILDITSKQTKMHFDLLEKQSKERTRKNILVCIIVCFSLLVYSLNYMNYTATYLKKIDKIETQLQKGGEEDGR